MKLLFCFLTLSGAAWGAQYVDIACYAPYLLPHPENLIMYDLLQGEFDLRFTENTYIYANSFRHDRPNLRKIIFFETCNDPKMRKLPHHKMICFKWEPTKPHPSDYDFYTRVYTFDDDLVDNVKFFKFYYPVLQPMLDDIPSFQEKKLCTWIVSHWIPERVKLVDFFASKPKNTLALHGNAPRHYDSHEMYKGRISGRYSGKEKLNTLKSYRFCICFENTHTIPGYITEKIFDAFAAGCVPIYWGPENIEDYIPAGSFIDYRKFRDNEEMYQFITSMTGYEYAQYIDNIQEFLESERAQLFSQERFLNQLREAILSP